MKRTKKALWIVVGSLVAVALLGGGIAAAVSWANTPRDRTADSPLTVGEEKQLRVPANSSSFTVPFTVEEGDVHRIRVEGSRGSGGAFEVRDGDGDVVVQAQDVPESLGGPQQAAMIGAMGVARLEPGDHELVLTEGPNPLDATLTFHVDPAHAVPLEPETPVAPRSADGTWVGTVELPEDAQGVAMRMTGSGLIGTGTGAYVVDSTGKVWTGDLSVGDGNALTIEDPAPGELIVVLSNGSNSSDAEFVVDVS